MNTSKNKGGVKTTARSVKPAGMRMKALTEATGLPKSAILHYVAQGLLPEPVRTSPNMAYYDPACIERIEFIRAMQEKYALPLSKIKMLLSRRDEGMDVTPLIELGATIFGNPEDALLGEAGFCEATGLRPVEVRKLKKLGLLLPSEKGRYNQQDVEIGGIYARCIALGATANDFIFYAEAAKGIVDREMQLRSKLTAHLPDAQDAELTRQMVMGARALRAYVIERTFQQRVAKAEGLKDKALLGGQDGTKSN